MLSHRTKNLGTSLFTAMLIVSVALVPSANADTYNFFFSKPGKKNGKKAPEATESGADESEDSTPESETEKAETPPPAAVAPVPPPEAGHTASVPNTAPIVINNNITNSTPTPSEKPPSEGLPAAPPPVERTESGKSEESVAYEPPPRRGHPIKIGVNLGTFDYDPSDWWGNDPDPSKSGFGLNLGLAFTRHLHWSIYGSSVPAFKDEPIPLYVGTDLEIYPISLGNDSHEIFQLGVILGASSAASAHSNVGSLHTGARLNLQFNEHFALTAASRVNLGYTMAEVGIVTRL